MSTKAKCEELERQRLDLELDRELEATFPASDALKITRPSRKRPCASGRDSPSPSSGKTRG
jgi:hypothetical protein